MTIAGRAVLVTGANRGIGKALVDEALKRGAKRVYAGTRQPVAHSDERVTPVTLDVTNAAQIQQAVERVESLDLLINNAGLAVYDDLSDRAALERQEGRRPPIVGVRDARRNCWRLIAIAMLFGIETLRPDFPCLRRQAVLKPDLDEKLIFSCFPLSKSTLLTRHPYRGGLTVKLATEEVNDVSILFGNHGISRRRGCFYRRAGSIGCESFSQKERSRRNRPESE